MLNGTTARMATQRGLKVEFYSDIYEGPEGYIDVIDIMTFDEDAEMAFVVYRVNGDGSYTLHECHHADLREELPAQLRDEKHLREVIKFIGDTVK